MDRFLERIGAALAIVLLAPFLVAGRFVRGTPLDELPKLFGIARGELTLLGGRADRRCEIQRPRGRPARQRRAAACLASRSGVRVRRGRLRGSR